MSSETPQAAADTPVPPGTARYRLRFRKGDDLRFVSHHDLMRCFERMFRRADLPVRASGGFHPKPRIIFALSLPLGVVGTEEVSEVELTQPLPVEEVQSRLTAQAPPGLTFLSVRLLGPGSSVRIHRLGYRVAVPPDRRADLDGRIAEVLSAAECWAERTRPRPRRVNLRPFLDQVRWTGEAVEMDLWLTPDGTARPEEVLHLLGLDDLVGQGTALERYRLELSDETPQDRREEHTPSPTRPSHVDAAAPAGSSLDAP